MNIPNGTIVEMQTVDESWMLYRVTGGVGAALTVEPIPLEHNRRDDDDTEFEDTFSIKIHIEKNSSGANIPMTYKGSARIISDTDDTKVEIEITGALSRERRTSRRLSCRIDADVEFVGHETLPPARGTIIDLSDSGAKIVLPSLNENRKVHVPFSLAPSVLLRIECRMMGDPFIAMIRVTNINVEDSAIGGEFIRFTPRSQSKLAEFLTYGERSDEFA